MSAALALKDYLAARRALVDEHLARWLIAPPACPAIVGDAMRYSLLGGGKRFRPLLALAAGDAVAARPDAAQVHAAGARRKPDATDPATSEQDVIRLVMPAACALEMIHTYSLIHDDLPAMDNDTLRRGRPTLHVVYGEGMAILAGDGLLTEAFALLATRPDVDRPELLARRLRTLREIAEAAGAAGMVGGQAVDLQAAGSGSVERRAAPLSFDALRDMHARKTGALIRASAVAGAVMAGGTEEAIEAIRAYAVGLGLAFQIVDDILDVEGATEELGKTAGKDAAAGKPTYPALFGLERSRALAAEALEQALASLAHAGLGGGRLDEIARWVTGRTN